VAAGQDVYRRPLVSADPHQLLQPDH